MTKQANRFSLLHARLEAAQLKLRQAQEFYARSPKNTSQSEITCLTAEIRQLARLLVKEYAK